MVHIVTIFTQRA